MGGRRSGAGAWTWGRGARGRDRIVVESLHFLLFISWVIKQRYFHAL
jgi:hypothetical protein